MEWLENKINSLRHIGFFNNESNHELIERLIKESESHYYGQILKHEHHPDLIYILTSYDKANTWFTENESDQRSNTWVIESGLELEHEWTLEFQIKFYYEVFNRLAIISKGSFKPVDLQIKECGYCAGIAERFEVNFFFNEKQHNLFFCIDHPKVLLSFLAELNEIISPTGYSFVHYIERNYTSFFVYFFNEKQKEVFDSLIDYTHDSKEDYTIYWLKKAEYYEQQEQDKLAYFCFKKAIDNKGKVEDTISAIILFGQFLTQQGKHQEAKIQYKQGIVLIENKTIISEWDKWQISIFEQLLQD